MRRIVIVILAAGLTTVGTTPAAAQLPQVPLPEVQLPVPDAPDVQLPQPPGDDGGGGGGGGGGDSDPLPKLPVLESGSSSGGDSGSSGGSSSGGGGSGSVSGSLGGSGGGGSGGSGASGGGGSGSGRDGRSNSGRSGGGGSGAYSCPCAAPATGYPVAGDYDKCPEQGGASGVGSDKAGSVLATSRSEPSGRAEPGPRGGVLGATTFGEDGSDPPTAGAARFFEDSGPSLVAWALLGLAAVTLLFGIVGGVRAFEGRRG